MTAYIRISQIRWLGPFLVFMIHSLKYGRTGYDVFTKYKRYGVRRVKCLSRTYELFIPCFDECYVDLLPSMEQF